MLNKLYNDYNQIGFLVMDNKIPLAPVEDNKKWT